MPYGWSGQILRIDLSEKKTTIEDVMPYTRSFIGGRGINVKKIYDEVGPEISPFDPANRLCLGPGALAGTPAPSSSRTKITAMSPRGLLDSSGIGGFIGAEIKYAGYDNIIIQGKSDTPVYIYIRDDSVKFRDASHLWGKDPWEAQEMIRNELGDRDIQAVSIGLGGENLVSFASITTGRMASSAGRGGLGAIMGSKKLKAIAVRGTRSLKIAKEAEFTQACLEMFKVIREGSIYGYERNDVTDKRLPGSYVDTGKLVVGNWEDADWHEANIYNLNDNAEEFWSKYGVFQVGCFGCPVPHATAFNIPEHDGCVGRVKCVEWLSFSGTVWITDRKQIVQATYHCNKYGLDVVSTANCISFLMELYHRGIITEKDTDGILMKRGDINAIISAIHKIGNQEGFGKLFKDGVLKAARQIGRGAEECAMQVKGREMFPEEGRAYKSIALLASVGKAEEYSVIDHDWARAKADKEKWAVDLFGNREAAFPTSYKDKALVVWDSENRHCAGDLLGVCKFIIPWGFTLSMELPAKLFSLATGVDTTEDELLTAAQRVLTLERAFNVARGIRRKDDTPPKRLFEIPIRSGVLKGEVLDKEQFDRMLSEYYALRGYDEDGIPEEETFNKLGLLLEGKIFKERVAKNELAKSSLGKTKN
jgi:aldehyde:ferredoxin oxidoreductase